MGMATRGGMRGRMRREWMIWVVGRGGLWKLGLQGRGLSLGEQRSEVRINFNRFCYISNCKWGVITSCETLPLITASCNRRVQLPKSNSRHRIFQGRRRCFPRIIPANKRLYKSYSPPSHQFQFWLHGAVASTSSIKESLRGERGSAWDSLGPYSCLVKDGVMTGKPTFDSWWRHSFLPLFVMLPHSFVPSR